MDVDELTVRLRICPELAAINKTPYVIGGMSRYPPESTPRRVDMFLTHFWICSPSVPSLKQKQREDHVLWLSNPIDTRIRLSTSGASLRTTNKRLAWPCFIVSTTMCLRPYNGPVDTARCCNPDAVTGAAIDILAPILCQHMGRG